MSLTEVTISDSCITGSYGTVSNENGEHEQFIISEIKHSLIFYCLFIGMYTLRLETVHNNTPNIVAYIV